MDIENRRIKEETGPDNGGETITDDGDGGGEEGNLNNNELPDDDVHYQQQQQQPGTKTIYSLNINVCRLCLCEGQGNLQPVFYSKDAPDVILQHKILELTTVEITYALDFPTSICIDCLTRVEELAIFRRQCVENNELLRLKYLELKAEFDCYPDHVKVEQQDDQQYGDDGGATGSLSIVKKEEKPDVDGLLIEAGTASVVHGNSVTEAEANEATVDAGDDDIIIGGAEDSTTKIQYVNDDGTMMEYVAESLSPSARPTTLVMRRASEVDEELRYEAGYEVGAHGDEEVAERHEIYYTVGTDTYAIEANAAGAGYTHATNYVPPGFDNQTEIECTTIDEHLPEEYVEEEGSTVAIAGPGASTVSSSSGGNTGGAVVSARGIHDRPFVCKHCKTSFKYEHNYDRHMKNHAKVLYRCGKCSKTFVKLRKCQQHHIKAHSSQRYECDICFRTYSLPTRLENHVIEMHSENGVYTCDRCIGEKFVSYLDFKAHRMQYHARNEAATGTTDTVPAIIKQTTHGDVVHMQKLEAPLLSTLEDEDDDDDADSPDLSTTDGYELEDILVEHTTSNRKGRTQDTASKRKVGGRLKTVPANVVPRTRRSNGEGTNRGVTAKTQQRNRQATSNNSAHQQPHEVILIDDDDQQHNGIMAGVRRQAQSDTMLRMHDGMEVDSGNALHRQLLQQIEESEASSIGPKVYPCESCNKTFVHLNNLKAHIYAEHDNDKPFKCKLCPISFKTKEILVMHMLLHSQQQSGSAI
ncbi:zinc finger and BTB domain-containing protein 17-like [Anopheles darlingi]|uniref:zinc finger and BTB domain-containing protein 17-like n=1 Tax=Anopheles darlingi TaxID=43151 RepID=UPI0021002811|nr:zinc finger and BTB domain-containing protein 17-like [Anopheles darlingi]